MSDGLLFAASILAVYRLARLVAVDTVTARFRDWVTRQPGRIARELGYLVSCAWCLGPWLAAALTVVLAAGPGIPLPLLWLPAIAGGSALLTSADERMNRGQHG